MGGVICRGDVEERETGASRSLIVTRRVRGTEGGQGKLMHLHTHSHTHTNAAGCELRAGMVAEEIVVFLSGGAPWGFRLQGGAEQQKPLQVAKV